MQIITLVVLVLVVLLTAGWNGWVRPLPPGPGFYGGSLVWFVVVLVLILWLLGVPTLVLRG